MLGIPLKEGDTVAVAEATYNGGAYMSISEVIGFTPKRIRLKDKSLKSSDKLLLFTAQNNHNYDNSPEYMIWP